jgi:3-deoxy-D-manno-octulosonic-acid transferase
MGRSTKGSEKQARPFEVLLAFMLWLYRLLFLPVLILLSPGYLRRMKKRGGYQENFSHRFGAHPPQHPKKPGVKRVWLQAVSVGEMLAIAPLLEALYRDGSEVYLTTTTSTGHKLAHERYRGLIVGLGYFPIDWWPFSARAWRRIDPDLVILTEGERWPEHLWQAERRGVPVICINARLSDRSYRRMKLFGPAARLMIGGITRLLPCSVQDEARFRELGFPAAKITTTGNIKLDVSIPILAPAERAQLKRELGIGEGLVLLGSSTWPGEEAALLGALERARREGLRCSLLLVPRHAERRGEIEGQLLQRPELKFHFRSKGAAPGEVDVAVGDTTGELRKLTQLADLVFVGKSLPPHTEGQTPVEAAALERPIMFGPGMGSFRVIANDLVSRGAAQIVPGEAALATMTANLLREESRRLALARAAAAWHRDNAGAVARTLAVIREELAKV